jgi:PAS domain S-box-containing protein
MVTTPSSHQKGTSQPEHIILLPEDHQLYRTLAEISPDAIVITDLETNVVMANRQAALTHGYESTEELIGRNAFEFIAPEDHHRAIEDAQKTLEQGSVRNIEYTLLRQDGSRFPAELSASVVTDSQGRPRAFIGVVRDITEHKRREQELIRLERFEALADIAAGISHSLNNILTSIYGSAQLLARATYDQKVLRWISRILVSTAKATKMLRRLDQVMRSGAEGAFHPVLVNEAVGEAVQEIQHLRINGLEARGVQIQLATELQEDIPPIQGTESGLHDILMELLNNAVDALPQGGNIAISTRAIGDQVCLQVSDDGVGMDEATRKRVFEPFFTTKVDVGTGLGLFNVYATVTRWGGHIDVTSEPGKGATFTVYFNVCSITPGPGETEDA